MFRIVWFICRERFVRELGVWCAIIKMWCKESLNKTLVYMRKRRCKSMYGDQSCWRVGWCTVLGPLIFLSSVENASKFDVSLKKKRWTSYLLEIISNELWHKYKHKKTREVALLNYSYAAKQTIDHLVVHNFSFKAVQALELDGF